MPRAPGSQVEPDAGDRTRTCDLRIMIQASGGGLGWQSQKQAGNGLYEWLELLRLDHGLDHDLRTGNVSASDAVHHRGVPGGLRGGADERLRDRRRRWTRLRVHPASGRARHRRDRGTPALEKEGVAGGPGGGRCTQRRSRCASATGDAPVRDLAGGMVAPITPQRWVGRALARDLRKGRSERWILRGPGDSWTWSRVRRGFSPG